MWSKMDEETNLFIACSKSKHETQVLLQALPCVSCQEMCHFMCELNKALQKGLVSCLATGIAMFLFMCLVSSCFDKTHLHVSQNTGLASGIAMCLFLCLVSSCLDKTHVSLHVLMRHMCLVNVFDKTFSTHVSCQGMTHLSWQDKCVSSSDTRVLLYMCLRKQVWAMSAARHMLEETCVSKHKTNIKQSVFMLT